MTIEKSASVTLREVNDRIVEAANAQPVESIEQAIQSFGWVSIPDRYNAVDPQNEKTARLSGYVESPETYLNHASNKEASSMSEIVSMQEVLGNFKVPHFRFQQGVSSFLQCGIPEALASLKIPWNATSVRPQVPEPFSTLITPETLRNPDPKRFQGSIQAVTEMFTTLKKVVAANTDLQMNMLRFVRA